jgi:RND family efflux transporter MFP subunit
MPFQQGALVKAGDELAKIYQPPFQAMVNEMDGELSSDEASLKLAQSQVDRSKPLLSGNLVSEQTYDGYVSQVDQLKGKVKVDQAQLDLAQINLNYTNITAPVDGMVGTYNINVGNVVKVNDLPITTIQRMDPIYVDFVVSVTNFPTLRKYFDQNGGGLPVHVASQSNPDQERDGHGVVAGGIAECGPAVLAERAGAGADFPGNVEGRGAGAVAGGAIEPAGAVCVCGEAAGEGGRSADGGEAAGGNRAGAG